MKPATLVILSLFSLLGLAHASVGCRDDDGNPVDWFIVYKMPVLPKSKNSNFNNGYGYASLDPSHTTAFKISDKTLDQETGYLGQTLGQVYDGAKTKVGWVMYNDQNPDGTTTSTYGHTKGVVGFDGTSGFWLIHSVPRWPEPHGTAYAFPDNERIYGQNFICVTLDISQMNDIGYQMFFTRPWVYDSNLPSSFKSKTTNLQSVIDGTYQKASNASIRQFPSKAHTSFVHMAKNVKWNDDLYQGLVSPFIDDGLYVESWMRPYFDSFCPPKFDYQLENVATLVLGADVAFSETNDHSKWAISINDKSWVCVGDINHQQSQYTRSGGTMCFQNKNVHAAYSAMIDTINTC